MRLCWIFALLSFLAVPAPALMIPVPSDDTVLAMLREKLKGQGDLIEKRVKRLGSKTIELETFISTEAEFNDASVIFSDLKNIPNWALTNINNRPQGGTYLIKIQSMRYTPAGPGTYALDFLLDLPLFKKNLICDVKVSTRRRPGAFTLIGEMVPNEKSHVEWADAVLKMYPAEKTPHRVWIYVAGKMRIRNWLMYEALPEKLLNRESGERTQILLDNYLREEDRYRARNPSSRKRK